MPNACLYLTFVILVFTGLYELFRIPYFDALGIAWYSFKEGKEAFAKVSTKKVVCAVEC